MVWRAVGHGWCAVAMEVAAAAVMLPVLLFLLLLPPLPLLLLLFLLLAGNAARWPSHMPACRPD